MITYQKSLIPNYHFQNIVVEESFLVLTLYDFLFIQVIILSKVYFIK